MIDGANMPARLAIDSTDLNAVRQAARQNSPEALKAAAQQFEALFMNMVMKSMRQATSQDGLFDNEQSKMYTSMLDQQLSQNFAKRGVGLADALLRQLSNNGSSVLPQAGPEPAVFADPFRQDFVAAPPAAIAPKRFASQSGHVAAFRERLAGHAEEASRTTGIPARFMLGQAALESGWGRREILHADGTPSHNLFGIKATGGWKGKVVETMTTEYVNGVVEKRMEKFRAYDSYADAFRDYGRMLSTNPRYKDVIAQAQDAAGFAQGLQRAGYATDPNYAAKLTRIIEQSLSI